MSLSILKDHLRLSSSASAQRSVHQQALDRVLSPKEFPRTLKDGYTFIARAADQLKSELQRLKTRSHKTRTFENTVMSYHHSMIAFDAAERLIRSERLIADDTLGKKQLLNQCIRIKNAVFSDSDLLKVFITYADQMAQTHTLSDLQWQCLKGIIHSMKEITAPKECIELLRSVTVAIKKRGKSVFCSYLMGTYPSKTLSKPQRKISFLTLNLCMMPESNSMIYGGVLPWTARIDGIVKTLKNIPSDVLFLQEIYDVRAFFALYQGLSSSYTHFYGNIPIKLCGFSHESLFSTSGLALISKYDLKNVRFEPYQSITHDNQSSGFDRLKVFGFDRNYGILHCDVMQGKKPFVHFAMTHTNPFYADIRAHQIEQVIRSLKEQSKNSPETPAIFCGDLNIEQNDYNERGERLIKEHFVDHYTGGPTWNDFGNFWAHQWHTSNASQFLAKNPRSWTVDRSLLWAPWARYWPYSMRAARVKVHDPQRPDLAITDHHGIHTHFKYEEMRSRL